LNFDKWNMASLLNYFFKKQMDIAFTFQYSLNTYEFVDLISLF
jgi:hypothetical protein